MHVFDIYKQSIPSSVLNPPNQRIQKGRGGARFYIIISEQGLYQLISQSQLDNPQIEEFKKWMYKTIQDMREYGMSMSDQLMNSCSKEELADMVVNYKSVVDAAQPAIHMYHQNTQNTATITAQQIADNYGWTAQRLNAALYALGFHYPSGDGWVLYKKYKDQGLVSTITRQTEDGIVDFTTGYTEKGRNLVDQILHDNGYRTKQESIDEIDRRIQIANERATQCNNMYQQPQPIYNTYNNNYNYFFSSNPDQTLDQINSIQDPRARNEAKQAFYNHLYNQPSKDTFIDKDGNKRTKDGLLVVMTDKYGNPL